MKPYKLTHLDLHILNLSNLTQPQSLELIRNVNAYPWKALNLVTWKPLLSFTCVCWGLGSALWLVLTVSLFWEKLEKHLFHADKPDPFADFVTMEQPTSPVLAAFLFAASVPIVSFVLGVAITLIYKGFVSSKG